MRVVCDVFTPKADSYGHNQVSTHVFPNKSEPNDIHNAIDLAIGGMRRFKPGMKIEINFEEDWSE